MFFHLLTKKRRKHDRVSSTNRASRRRTMPWTTPRTWVNNEPLTASDMNAHIRDNLNALKSPATDHYEANESSNYTTTSTTFVSIDATNLSLDITTMGGDIL